MVRNEAAEQKRDTIFALSTAPGAGAVAVVRVSGPDAESALALTRGGSVAPRTAVLRRVFEPSNGSRIDDALIMWFPAPKSYTGENVLEIQTHGSRAVIGALTGALAKLPRFRPAEPGEFTRRAVENGRMDLTRAEAIADLVAAETEAQRKLALQQYDGALADLYQQWRGQLIRAAAWIEAAIDFPDEEIPENTWSDSRSTLTALKRQLLAHLNDQRRGEIVREGFQIAVIGPPNAGKSSLVNALARRDVAIVSDIPGTTRDIIEVKLDLGGYAVVLADTAGLRQSLEPIEQEGVRRALARAEAADFRLVVQDATADQTGLEGDLVIHNKADLVESRQPDELYISAKTGEGLDELVRVLTAKAAERMSVGEAPLLTRARHRHAVERAAAEIGAAMDEREPELAAERLRRAMRHLGRITGAVDLDELLDVVFRDFCIGK